MMTVRFPNGQAVRYNTATFAFRHANYTDIYERSGADRTGQGWIAQIPHTCIIEQVPACAVYNALQEDSRLAGIEKELRAIKRRLPKP